MNQKSYDLFVIGGGSGGVRAARIAAGHGAKVGLCEEYRLGGTCVIRGCVPKKLLSYAAHFAEDFEDAAGYGWSVEGVRFSWPDLIANKDREIGRLEEVYGRLLDNSGVRVHAARGRLLDSHHVQVGDETIEAGRILLAAGGRPWLPDIDGAELAISSNEVFHLRELPGSVVVVGGGYIACEFAGIFNGLGAEVTQVYRGDRVLRGFDEDVRDALTREMRRKGIIFRFDENPTRLERRGASIRVHLGDGHVDADQVLFATGRVPNSAGLGLQDAGVEVRADGSIPVDEYSCTNLPSVFAVGDITHRVNLTPVAIHEGHAFADSEFGGQRRPVDHEFIPSAVFSNPQVGTVGYSEQLASHHYGDLDVYRSEFTPMKHTMTGREGKALMKLVVERSGQRVVGLHVVGPDAPEIVQGFAVAVKSGLTKQQFDATIGIHPTAAEELVTLRTPAQGRGPQS